MRSFAYLRPASVEEALAVLAEHRAEAKVMGGGQSLLLELKERLIAPSVVVALGGIRELRGYSEANGFVIGPTTTYRAISTNPPPDGYRKLADVVANIADRPVQTMATIGGAICQADPRFDLPVIATMLRAELVLRSTTRSRRVTAEEFFLGPTRTALEDDELLCAVQFPQRDPKSRWSFQKFRLRSMDAAMISVGVSLRFDDGSCSGATVVVGGCTKVPTRLPNVETELENSTLESTEIARIGSLCKEAVEPPARPWPFLDPTYLRHMVGVLMERSLSDIASQGDGENARGS